MIKAKKIFMHPISEALCEAYRKLYEKGQVSFPLHEKQRQAIDSVVKTVNANYFGVERFPSPQDKAVAYLYFIIKDHPMTDGNKRLSILWFSVYCKVHKLTPKVSEYGLDVLAVAIEKSDLHVEKSMEIVKSILFQ